MGTPRVGKAVKERRIFYGYWVVLAGTLLAALNSGTYFFGFGAFFKPIISEFGWSRTALSGAFSLAQLEGGLLGPLEGWLIDKIGARKVLFMGVPLLGIGFFLIGMVNSILTFYLVFALFLALGSALGSVAPVAAAVANWFNKKQSTMMGLTLAGVGLGSALVPIVTWLIDAFGWRMAAMALGGFTFAVGLPLAALVRHRPEPYGYYPDDEPPAGAQSAGPATADVTASTSAQPQPRGASSTAVSDPVVLDDSSLTPIEALRNGAFWLLSFAFAIRIMATSSVTLHLIAFLTDMGESAQTAGFMVSFLGVAGIVGRIAFGWLGDIFNKRHVVIGGLASLTLGMVILANSTTLLRAFLGLVFFSPAYGGLATMMFAIRGEYFGSRYYATIQGFMGTVIILGTISGPIFAGWVFDTTGSYRIAFYTFAAFVVLAMALVWAAKKPRKRVEAALRMETA